MDEKSPHETPAEVLHSLALHAAFIWCDGRRLPAGSRHFRTTPGAVIERLPEHRRAILRELKSSDIAALRPDTLPL